MTNQLIPSEDEVNKIITQLIQTDPTRLPIVLLQIELARITLKILDRLRNELDQSIKELEERMEL